MTSRTTASFRKKFADLPENLRHQAREAYRKFQQDPQHRSLRFKRVHDTQPVYSVRINLEYRAVGIRTSEAIVWFWVGSHAEYDEFLKSL